MPASPEPQRRLGSAYILDEMIGSGVQGTVWKGRKEDSDQPLAFKILRRDLTSEPGVVDAFLRERETLRRITSPNVIEVHDIVAENGTLGLVMDYVDGGDLDDLIRSRGALEPAMIAYLGANIAAGIGAVHAAGVVHGDIKPANILIDSSTTPGTPKIADFGIARICDSTAATRTAVGMGTLVYMAPEASAGVPPSPTKDVYALGIVLYQLACGVPPFVGSPAYLVKMHSQMAPGRPAGIPDQLWDLISRMLDKDPAKRPSVLEVYQTLAPLTTALAGRPAAPTLTEPPAASPLPDREGAQTVIAPLNAPGAPAPAGGRPSIRLSVQPPAPSDTTATGPVLSPADPAPPRQERGRGRRPALAALLLVLALVDRRGRRGRGRLPPAGDPGRRDLDDVEDAPETRGSVRRGGRAGRSGRDLPGGGRRGRGLPGRSRLGGGEQGGADGGRRPHPVARHGRRGGRLEPDEPAGAPAAGGRRPGHRVPERARVHRPQRLGLLLRRQLRPRRRGRRPGGREGPILLPGEVLLPERLLSDGGARVRARSGTGPDRFDQFPVARERRPGNSLPTPRPPLPDSPGMSQSCLDTLTRSRRS